MSSNKAPATPKRVKIFFHGSPVLETVDGKKVVPSDQTDGPSDGLPSSQAERSPPTQAGATHLAAVQRPRASEGEPSWPESQQVRRSSRLVNTTHQDPAPPSASTTSRPRTHIQDHRRTQSDMASSSRNDGGEAPRMPHNVLNRQNERRSQPAMGSTIPAQWPGANPQGLIPGNPLFAANDPRRQTQMAPGYVNPLASMQQFPPPRQLLPSAAVPLSQMPPPMPQGHRRQTVTQPPALQPVNRGPAQSSSYWQLPAFVPPPEQPSRPQSVRRQPVIQRPVQQPSNRGHAQNSPYWQMPPFPPPSQVGRNPSSASTTTQPPKQQQPPQSMRMPATPTQPEQRRPSSANRPALPQQPAQAPIPSHWYTDELPPASPPRGRRAAPAGFRATVPVNQPPTQQQEKKQTKRLVSYSSSSSSLSSLPDSSPNQPASFATAPAPTAGRGDRSANARKRPRAALFDDIFVNPGEEETAAPTPPISKKQKKAAVPPTAGPSVSVFPPIASGTAAAQEADALPSSSIRRSTRIASSGQGKVKGKGSSSSSSSDSSYSEASSTSESTSREATKKKAGKTRSGAERSAAPEPKAKPRRTRVADRYEMVGGPVEPVLAAPPSGAPMTVPRAGGVFERLRRMREEREMVGRIEPGDRAEADGIERAEEGLGDRR
ncbi:uncharacterized protein AB675_2259 [Cyphellophora attinorum]|uniref:Uncharacterized protein n=1 Tax=Cyphellophora attinorum TaxID=1664694 RepID=A0A0N1H1S3_9EURO|nr:uncharacterized protein AB675_2259 [Phialophora attinorum]KPI34882.1 hypothetical protein AB675_2259 [Phialophora attinorum]